MKKIAGINGFGRFGLHLLKYWLDRASSSNFSIGYINDDTINTGAIELSWKEKIQISLYLF